MLVSPLLPNTFVLAFSRASSCNGLSVNAICRLIALSFATALTGCATQGFDVSSQDGILVGDSTLGYAFTISSPIRMTDLGLYHFDIWTGLLINIPSLSDEHWHAAVQTTIPAGTPGKLIDYFRYVPIAPFILAQAFIQSAPPLQPKFPSHPSRTLIGFCSTRRLQVLTRFPTSVRSAIGKGFRFPSGNEPLPQSGEVLSLRFLRSKFLVYVRRPDPGSHALPSTDSTSRRAARRRALQKPSSRF